MIEFVLDLCPLNVAIVTSVPYRSNDICLIQGLLLILLQKKQTNKKKNQQKTQLYAVMMIHLQF